jgi:hypothetical protein
MGIMRTALVALLSVLALAATAMETVECTLPGAIPLDLKRADQWKRYAGIATPAADLIVRLRAVDGVIQPIAWAHSPQMLTQQFLVSVSGTPADGDGVITASVELYPLQRFARRGGPLYLEGDLQLQLTLSGDGGSFSATGKPDTDPAKRAELAELMGFIPEPGRARRPKSFDNELVADLAARTVDGTVTVRRLPGPKPIADIARSAPGEHPRLFLTKADLPRVREWAATKTGKARIAWLERRLEDAIHNGFGFHHGGEHSMLPLWAAGHGLLYQLTGDTSHADRAGELVWNGMTSALPNKNQWRQSYRILGTAMAYDLCAEVWDDELRSNVYHYLLRQALHFAQREDQADPLGFGTRYDYQGETRPWGSSIRSHAYHFYAAAAGLGAMAILGDEPPIPEAPDLSDIPTIAPADGYVPPIGVPVSELVDGQMFPRFLANGPFPMEEVEPLKDVGGWAIRPEPGQRVDSVGIPVDWRIFHPAGSGQSRGRGPVLYPRESMKYFTNATGMGYFPGRAVADKLNQVYKDMDSKKRAGLAATWYTVWDNPVERLIMAQPNWHWPSRGIRMWVNGEEVVDGSVVRVKPGLYPVMIWVPIRGGYNLQAPHLREISETEVAEQRKRNALIAAGLKPDGGPEENLVAWLAEALLEQVRLHIEETVDADGWNYHIAADHVLPFLAAARAGTGYDWLSGTGYDKVLRQLVLTAPYSEGRTAAFTAAHISHRGSEEERRIARWFLDSYGYGSQRPSDLVVPMLMSDPTVAPLSPAEAGWSKTLFQEESNAFVFVNRLEREGDGDILVTFLGGGDPVQSVYDALQVGMWGYEAQGRGNAQRRGRPLWFQTVGWEGGLDSMATAPRVKDLAPGAPAKLTHSHQEADGSGSVTLLLDHLVAMKVGDNGKVAITDERRKKASIQRSVLVDFSGTAGTPGVVVVADRFRGFKRGEMKWQQWYGKSNTSHSYHGEDSKRYAIRFFKDSDQVGIRDKRQLKKVDRQRRGLDTHHYLFGTSIADRPIEFSLNAIGHSPADGSLRVVMDRPKDGGRRDQPQEEEFEDDLGDFGELGDLGGEIDDIVSGDNEADAEYVGNDDRMIMVWTVQASDPPAVTRRPDGQDLLITVGGATYRYDGAKLSRE